MNKIYILCMLVIAACGFSCDHDDGPEKLKVAVPVSMSLNTLRSSVTVEKPEKIENVGKIYAYKNYIFINDKFKGVHIIDNTNPKSPKKVKFIKIPGNVDIAVKDDVLYADSVIDLVTFDINDINNIKEVGRVKDVFMKSYSFFVNDEDIVGWDYSSFNWEEDIVVGYTIEYKTREELGWNEYIDIATQDSFNNNGNTGKGGSLARFNIVDYYLYTVDQSNLSVFDIRNLNSPKPLGQEYIGWDIETIFNQGDYLYIGSRTGMLIYDILNRATPVHKSTVSHWMGCDPVVVQGNFAYVTLRGGNLCGQPESVLEVYDVNDKSNPKLLKAYTMDSPYGLGVKDNLLFVCDGDSGLKVFDASNTPELKLEQKYKNVNAIDVIPLNETLLMIGDNVLNQYTYENKSINLLSTFLLN